MMSNEHLRWSKRDLFASTTSAAVPASWSAIAAFSIGLAVLSAVVLQRQGFDAPSGIAFGVAYLSLSQIAYLGGACTTRRGLFEKETDKKPRDRRDNGIAGNQRRQQKRPSWFA